MKTLIYQVYTGERSALYDHCTQSVKEYADRIGAHYLIQREPILRIQPDIFLTERKGKTGGWQQIGYLPIFEKENAFAYLDSYDQIAIIDADIFVRPGCNECLFSASGADCDFAGVIERTMPITHEYQNKIHNYSRMQYSHSQISPLFDWNNLGANFYNMGMMVINKSISKYLRGDTPEKFIRRPEFKPFVDGMGPWKWSTDQTLLNYWVKKENMLVNNLDWKWNGLFSVNTEIKECNFIHFFLKDHLPNKGENVEELMKVI
jgi:hypothetical protein